MTNSNQVQECFKKKKKKNTTQNKQLQRQVRVDANLILQPLNIPVSTR